MHFNPRAPCGARRRSILHGFQIFNISIHAPLAGRDPVWRAMPNAWGPFQSTRPLRGATMASDISCMVMCYFNPRAPCGARPPGNPWSRRPAHFNPRAPCGARHGTFVSVHGYSAISIHAPLAGRDLEPTSPPMRPPNFNPRAPCGARHEQTADAQIRVDFNPRAPCGARRLELGAGLEELAFQSTRPLRGATPAVMASEYSV